MNFNDKPYEYLLERIKDLELELAAAQAEIKRLRGKCAAIEGNEIGYPCVALSEAQAQRDKAVFALVDLYEQQTNEYICKCCGLRAEPHRCKTGEEF